MRHRSIVSVAAVLVAAAANPSACPAQLVPDRVYFGIGRAVPMTVRIPADAVAALPEAKRSTPGSAPAEPGKPSGSGTNGDAASGTAAVLLIDPQSGEVLARGLVRPTGPESTAVDLADLIPSLWKRVSDRVLRAQLAVGARRIGPSVVLQPLSSPVYAPRSDRAGVPMFPPEKERVRVVSGLRAYVDRQVELETTQGRIVIGLRPEAAPNTCWHFRELVSGGLYTDVVVHRIASLAGKPEADIIQTGDPNGNGQGGCGEFIDLEPSTLPHDFGVVSMARFSDPNSASSQFMICLNREGTAYLDRRYAAFGVVVAGAEVVRTIAASPVGPDNRPRDPPMIRSARLVDAAPFGEGPPAQRDPLKREGR